MKMSSKTCPSLRSYLIGCQLCPLIGGSTVLYSPRVAVSEGGHYGIITIIIVQLETRHSLQGTFANLWREEGLGVLKKGLSARIISTAPTSALLVVSYEWVKRISLKPT